MMLADSVPSAGRCLAVAAVRMAQQTPAPQRTPDVIFVPTPQEVVDAMLKLAKVTKNDVIYDLGSGDGRIPITAAKTYGARGVGIDIDPQRIREANENLKCRRRRQGQVPESGPVHDRHQRGHGRDAYLLPSLNLKLLPKLNRS